MAALAVDGTREHSLYLIGSSPTGTLVEMWVEGTEDFGVTKVPHFGLLSLQVVNSYIKGEGLGRTRGTHND